MTKETKRYKEDICRLHREYKLKDVMDMMKDKGFEARSVFALNFSCCGILSYSA